MIEVISMENVAHPAHYCDGRKYEPKDVIRDWNLNFNLGSAVKYLARCGRKEGSSIGEDLLKAKQYIEYELEAIRNENEQLMETVKAMPKVRAGWKKGKYQLGKHEFYMAYHYALQYNAWKARKAEMTDMSHAIRYDADKVQTSPAADGIERVAMELLELDGKTEAVETAAKEASPGLWPWILKGATVEGMTYYKLKEQGIPCGARMYYEQRRKFYYLLSKKIRPGVNPRSGSGKLL